MIQIDEEKNCCGCGACMVVCPKKCIDMHEGSLGHLFPTIDLERCVNCAVCEKVCPMLLQADCPSYSKKAYVSYAADERTRFLGSSGGMFGVFADWAISNGYKVYGAAFDENLQLKCTLAEDKTALIKLYKSKYLQSCLSEKLTEIKTRLDFGEKVLFVSTPCQVAALKNFLRKNYENLITVDFFCHGVPSQIFFDKCLKIDEKNLVERLRAIRSAQKNIQVE